MFLIKLLKNMSKYNFLIFNFSKVIFLLIFFFKFALAVTNTCKTNNKLSNTDCFTDIIKFDGDNYRAGHAVVTSNDELFIEYSLDKESSNRLFYGLKKNGRNYFPDNSYVKLIDVGNDEGVYNRYESNNRIVKVVDSNTNTEKEYILSVSTFRTVVELYDIETFDVKIRNSIKYLKHQIFSFEFPILEAKDNNKYTILLFIFVLLVIQIIIGKIMLNMELKQDLMFRWQNLVFQPLISILVM